MSKVAQVLGDFLTAQPPPGSPKTFPYNGGDSAPTPPKDPKAPIRTFGDAAYDMVAGLIGGGGSAPTPPKDQGKPSLSSAVAAPAPPKDPFASGAAPVQAGPEQLIPALVAQAKAKAEQSKPPVQAPAATQPSPNVTPPVPPGVPIPPPPSQRPQEYTPSQPSFKGYEVRPPPPKKGEEKDRTKPLKKDNSLYYYSRIGVQQDDNRAVAERIRELREKAGNPKTAKNITPEEDRILTQYSDFAKRGGQSGMLKSMEPADVAKRMEEYRSGNLTTQMPDRYSERPPGVDGGGPAQLKLPANKKKDKAEDEVAKVIDNPPKRNATDPDIAVEDD
jgi:hypothetical protein